jgi:hypothetical protein
VVVPLLHLPLLSPELLLAAWCLCALQAPLRNGLSNCLVLSQSLVFGSGYFTTVALLTDTLLPLLL